ncbi:leucine-rich repeat domain-containing protein [Cellvibrio sp. OA-2007]|uniref:leucine-rich repeat domain-containing protein n=1 Tax=Cellvibrio sp. OA-2007 TaxID=529823 RepID=UPI000783A375|nr:hypothetical protein [Cellvibrio sp. OA-2007]
MYLDAKLIEGDAMKNGMMKISLYLAFCVLFGCGGDGNSRDNLGSSSFSSVVINSSVSKSSASVNNSSIENSSALSSVSSVQSNSAMSLSSLSSSGAAQSSVAKEIFINALFNKGGSLSPYSHVAINSGETRAFTVTPESGYRLAGTYGCNSRIEMGQVIAGPITQSCVMNVSFVRAGSLADQLNLTDRGLIRCITEMEDKSAAPITAASIKSLVCGNLFDPVSSYEELTLFPNLESLSLTGTRLNGSWSFGFFQKLTRLNLQDNELDAVDVSQNIKLTHLSLGKNRLTQINLVPLVNLLEFSAENNQLGAIDLTENTQLTALNLADNHLQSLQVAHLAQLTQLNVNRNQLTALDYSDNVKLVDLSIGWNKIASVDLSMLPELAALNLGSLNLERVDLSFNKKLVDLKLMENKLTALDVSMLPFLEKLSVYKNYLTALDLTLNTKLTDVNLLDNRLTQMDVSKLVDLKVLWATYNQITSINLSNNNQLQWVLLTDNKLTSVSGVEKLDKKTELDFSRNPLDAATKSYLFELYDKQGYEYLSF